MPARNTARIARRVEVERKDFIRVGIGRRRIAMSLMIVNMLAE